MVGSNDKVKQLGIVRGGYQEVIKTKQITQWKERVQSDAKGVWVGRWAIGCRHW